MAISGGRGGASPRAATSASGRGPHTTAARDLNGGAVHSCLGDRLAPGDHPPERDVGGTGTRRCRHQPDTGKVPQWRPPLPVDP
ncbi:unnamed protein product [Staurois parvus]|uniref:Uncharacterized protein n=1 Tax=Staurois parvus TaxID=386267 RepID=A0ABN9FYR9_9NEOB|nr:unnamed protein product [Staurois parvus]